MMDIICGANDFSNQELSKEEFKKGFEQYLDIVLSNPKCEGVVIAGPMGEELHRIYKDKVGE